MKRTKIIATIGPASEKKEIFEELIKAGMNIMRLNFSHGSHEEHLAKIQTLRELNKKLDTNVAIMLDTKGPEIRTGLYEDGVSHKVLKDSKLIITTRQVMSKDGIISVTYKNLASDIEVGSHILIDDGQIDVVVDKIEDTEIYTTVLNDGTILGRRGINVPGAKLKLEALTKIDIEDIKFGVENNVDFIAASFIRKAQDVIDIRDLLNELGNDRIKIISKIENQEGLDNFDEILKVSDGIMVARGDLGVEVPVEQLPAIQKIMIRKTTLAAKPVITATQMLESMQNNPRPTRAEVSDVANAVYDGTSAVMLSGESAKGAYPIEAVKMMAKIVEASEVNINYWNRFKKKNIERLTDFVHENLQDSFEFKKQANFAVCCSAMFSNADAIIAVSEHALVTSILSSFKPECPIYVITANETTYRQTSLDSAVMGIYIPGVYDFEKILNQGIEILKEKNLLKKGDTVVLSGGFPTTEDKKLIAAQATGTILKI